MAKIGRTDNLIHIILIPFTCPLSSPPAQSLGKSQIFKALKKLWVLQIQNQKMLHKIPVALT